MEKIKINFPLLWPLKKSSSQKKICPKRAPTPPAAPAVPAAAAAPTTPAVPAAAAAPARARLLLFCEFCFDFVRSKHQQQPLVIAQRNKKLPELISDRT